MFLDSLSYHSDSSISSLTCQGNSLKNSTTIQNNNNYKNKIDTK